MQSTDSAPPYSNTIHFECMLSMHHGVSAYVFSCAVLDPLVIKKKKSQKAPVD